MTSEDKKLLENEEFLRSLVEAKSPKELQDVLKKNNLQLEEGLTAEAALKLVEEAKKSELSESELEKVSGGIVPVIALGAFGAFVVSGWAISFLVGYGYQTFFRKR